MSSIKEISYPCKFDNSKQPAMFWSAQGDQPQPLVVALHTWSFTYKEGFEDYFRFCQTHNWNFIYPHFRGPNWTPSGCGSDLVVSDIEDSVSFMKSETHVDLNRVYLIGGSGGGHCSLLLAGRRPDLWTAVSAWCPISDIASWYYQCLNTRFHGYSENIVVSCGGIPEAKSAAEREARTRSPLTWLGNARELPIDINTGIHDGHQGSVPISQAMRAFNILSDPKEQIAESDIAYATSQEKFPSHLKATDSDPAYGKNYLHFRRQSHNVRLSIFEGGHDILSITGLSWLERQISHNPPDWASGQAIDGKNNYSELSK